MKIIDLVNKKCCFQVLAVGNYSFFLFALFISLSLVSPTICDSSPEIFNKCPDLLKTKVIKADGNECDLCEFQGKVLLIVNTASKCGFTMQYKDLEELHQQFQSKNFEVLAFPSGDFMWQEFATNEQIQKFCSEEFGVTFPLFAKSHIKGEEQNELFQQLSAQKGNPKWNFQKYLISRDGKVVGKFAPWIKPTDEQIVGAIEREIKNSNYIGSDM